MLELLRTRRSIRKYKQIPLDIAAVEALKEVLLRSPSSRNIQPWEFIFVQERELLSRLSESKEHGSSFLKDAACGVVICADETLSDVWVEDCSISAVLLQMEAQRLGIASCWIQIRNRKHDEQSDSENYIRKILCIPEKYRIDCIISLGIAAQTKPPISFDMLNFDKIHLEKW